MNQEQVNQEQVSQKQVNQSYICQTIQWYMFILILNGVFIGLYIFALKTETDIYQYVLLSIVGLVLVINVCYSIYGYYKNKKINKDDIKFVNDKVIMLITIYNETAEEVKKTIHSIRDNLNVDLDNILMIFVVDGVENFDYLYDEDLELNAFNSIENEMFNDTIEYNNNQVTFYYNKVNNVPYVLIYKHNQKGKKDSHGIVYDIFNRKLDITYFTDFKINYCELIRSYDYFLILDADTVIDQYTISIFINKFKKNDKQLGLCGTTDVYNKNETVITLIQVFEYFISHLLLKTFESEFYNTLVLSGCFTMFKIYKDANISNQNNTSPKTPEDVYIDIDLTNIREPFITSEILEIYNKQPHSLVEANVLKFGEDRYLTNLLIQHYPDYKISYTNATTCQTVVPTGFFNLIKQRIRWTNSLIFCHIHMLLGKFISFRLYFLIIYELFICLVIPTMIIISIVDIILYSVTYGYSLFLIIFTGNLILFELYITISVLEFKQILYFIIFLPLSWIFTILIPIISVIKVNYFAWKK